MTYAEKLISIVDCFMDDSDNLRKFLPLEHGFVDFLSEIGAYQILYLLKDEDAESYSYLMKHNEERIKKDRLQLLLAEKLSNFIIEKKMAAFIVKGPALSYILYGNISARSYTDLDIFCSKNNIYDLCDYLEKIGYKSASIEKQNEILFTKNFKKALFENDFENVFFSENRIPEIGHRLKVEVKTTDFVFEGGLLPDQVEKLCSSTQVYPIDGHMVCSLNLEGTFLQLVSNTFRNFDTSTGVQSDFRIRDLIDVLLFIKKYNYSIQTIKNILSPFGKTSEFGLILKYINQIFHSNFAHDLYMNYDEKPKVLYLTEDNINKLLYNPEYRLENYHQKLVKQFVARIDSNDICKSDSFLLEQTKLFDILHKNAIGLQIDYNDQYTKFTFTGLQGLLSYVHYYLNIRIIDLNDPKKFSFDTFIELYNGFCQFTDNPCGIRLVDEKDCLSLYLYDSNCLYRNAIAFCCSIYACKKNDWSCFNAWLNRQADPILLVARRDTET